MGKYLRKGKRVGEVAAEMTRASLGVSTRARTLALEQDRKISVALSESTKLQSPLTIDFCYLELRSRKLEKANKSISINGESNFGCEKPCVHSDSARPKEGCKSKDTGKAESTYPWKETHDSNDHMLTRAVDCSVNVSEIESFNQDFIRDASIGIEMGVVSVRKVLRRKVSHAQTRFNCYNSFDMSDGSQPLSLPLRLDGEMPWATEGANTKLFKGIEIETETSFSGDNTVEYERLLAHLCAESAQPRDTREGTPMPTFNSTELAVEAPGSTSRVRANHGFRMAARSEGEVLLPASHEIDKFFSDNETRYQGSLSERYNFDFDNDVPLEGRFEWRASADLRTSSL